MEVVVANVKKQKVDESEKQEEVKLGGLCEEYIADIFDHIPIKQLTQMKCLSKSWCHLISQYRRSKPRSSSSTLFCQYQFTDAEPTQVIFLDVKEQVGGEMVETHQHEFLNFSIHLVDLQILGCSNGILLSKKFKWKDNTLRSYVCNPTLNQWIALPPFSPDGSHIGMGLDFNGIANHHYQVVSYTLGKVKDKTKHLNCQIYSSDTGIWRKHKSRFFNSYLIFKKTLFVENPTYFYRKGMAHWVLYLCEHKGYMLVYHFQRDFFKLVPVPHELDSGKLWEADGCLHFGSDVYGTQFYIWKFVDDTVLNVEDDDQDTSKNWELKHTIRFETFKPHLPELVGPIHEKVLADRCFELCGFNDDLQTFYVALPGMIASYSLETRKLEKVSTCKVLRENDSASWSVFQVCASFLIQLNGIELPRGGECRLLYPKKESWGRKGRSILVLE